MSQLRHSICAPFRTHVVRFGAQILLVGLVAAGCVANTTIDTLPDLTLPLAEGGEINLTAPSDTPRVLNLWAVWCAPCREELPDFNRVHHAAAGSVDVIGINVGDSPDKAQELIEELALTFPQALDEDSALNSELAIIAMPSTIFVSPGGEVLEIHAGALTAAQLTEKIAELQGVQVSLAGG